MVGVRIRMDEHLLDFPGTMAQVWRMYDAAQSDPFPFLRLWLDLHKAGAIRAETA